ncbi:MAG TPA: D-alanyl-D-alanine carboxypeptidase family protein [Candidatus Binataceae bacterium]|nr:D-alanyl-D-alanine carboxypeptidase family protein [Candidatus Binataceae bacterium]
MVLVLVAVLIAPGAARATSHRARHRRHATRHHRSHYSTHGAPYHALLLEEADTGKILYDYNGGIQWPPASMAKMMLLLVAEEAIQSGRVHLNDPVTISANAAVTGGSRLGLLRAGEVVPLGELMKAALIRSANDAAVAVAEKVCGSTERCVALMNEQAKALGMTHTVYHTVEGLPPRPLHDVDTTNAYDLATLARALIHRTNLLQWSGMETASFEDGLVMLHNTNHLVGHFEGCDGLKTGFTIRAGFNLTATAERGNMRLIAVVLGAPNNSARFAQAARLMEWGFDNFAKVTVLKRGELLPVQVRVGTDEVMQPVAQNTVTVIVPKKDAASIKIDYAVPASQYGPLVSDQTVGHVIVRDGGEVLAECNAVCPFPVGQRPAVLNAMNGSDLNAHSATMQVEAPAR